MQSPCILLKFSVYPALVNTHILTLCAHTPVWMPLHKASTFVDSQRYNSGLPLPQQCATRRFSYANETSRGLRCHRLIPPLPETLCLWQLLCAGKKEWVLSYHSFSWQIKPRCSLQLTPQQSSLTLQLFSALRVTGMGESIKAHLSP